MAEIWKDIKEYEGLYQVSNFGRVKSLEKWSDTRHGPKTRKRPEMIKSLSYNANYMRVNLNKDNKKTLHYVHRLVAIAFIDNPNNKPEVNHLDGNKTNNNLFNLEWVTTKENLLHAWENGLGNNQYTYNYGKNTR